MKIDLIGKLLRFMSQNTIKYIFLLLLTGYLLLYKMVKANKLIKGENKRKLRVRK